MIGSCFVEENAWLLRFQKTSLKSLLSANELLKEKALFKIGRSIRLYYIPIFRFPDAWKILNPKN